MNRAGNVAGGTVSAGEAEQLGIRSAPLHVPREPGRLRQAADLADLAVLEVDPVDAGAPRCARETGDAERDVFAVATWIEHSGGRTVRQLAQHPVGCG